MNDPNFGEQLEPDDVPPILGSWNQLYAFVIIMHFILIALFYWFTKTYS